MTAIVSLVHASSSASRALDLVELPDGRVLPLMIALDGADDRDEGILTPRLPRPVGRVTAPTAAAERQRAEEAGLTGHAVDTFVGAKAGARANARSRDVLMMLATWVCGEEFAAGLAGQTVDAAPHYIAKRFSLCATRQQLATALAVLELEQHGIGGHGGAGGEGRCGTRHPAFAPLAASTTSVGGAWTSAIDWAEMLLLGAVRDAGLETRGVGFILDASDASDWASGAMGVMRLADGGHVALARPSDEDGEWWAAKARDLIRRAAKADPEGQEWEELLPLLPSAGAFDNARTRLTAALARPGEMVEAAYRSGAWRRQAERAGIRPRRGVGPPTTHAARA